MINKIIPIPSDDDRIYKQILSVLNFIIGLTPQEVDVLSEIIKLNHIYISLPEDKRAKFILSRDSRKEMRTKLDIKDIQFNGILNRLKSKTFINGPVLNDEGILHPELLFKPDNEGYKIEITLSKLINIPKVNKPIIIENQEETIVVEEKPIASYEVPPGPPENNEEQFEFTLL